MWGWGISPRSINNVFDPNLHAGDDGQLGLANFADQYEPKQLRVTADDEEFGKKHIVHVACGKFSSVALTGAVHIT